MLNTSPVLLRIGGIILLLLWPVGVIAHVMNKPQAMDWFTIAMVAYMGVFLLWISFRPGATLRFATGWVVLFLLVPFALGILMALAAFGIIPDWPWLRQVGGFFA